MINKTLSQKSRAHIVIIVILVVALLGILGFVFWQNFINKDTTNNTNTTQNNSPPANQDDNPEAAKNYLTLAEFNARIPLNDKTQNLKLGSATPSGYNESDKMLPIIAAELDSSWKCEVNPSNNVKGTIGMISVTFQAQRSGPYEPSITKKVGNYTFGFEQSGSNCTDSPEYQQLVDAFKVQFDKIEEQP